MILCHCQALNLNWCHLARRIHWWSSGNGAQMQIAPIAYAHVEMNTNHSILKEIPFFCNQWTNYTALRCVFVYVTTIILSLFFRSACTEFYPNLMLHLGAGLLLLGHDQCVYVVKSYSIASIDSTVERLHCCTRRWWCIIYSWICKSKYMIKMSYTLYRAFTITTIMSHLFLSSSGGFVVSKSILHICIKRQLMYAWSDHRWMLVPSKTIFQAMRMTAQQEFVGLLSAERCNHSGRLKGVHWIFVAWITDFSNFSIDDTEFKQFYILMEFHRIIFQHLSRLL